MKKLIIIALLFPFISLYPQEKDYYFDNTSFNPEISSPSEFMGYEIGDHHTRYDRIVDYMLYLAENSERVSFEQFGESVERRPQVIITICSPDNHAKLDQIRENHLKLSDPLNNPDPDKSIPIIIQLGFNVHGNEASGGEASLLSAYYLAAAQGAEIDNILSSSVIFIEPVLNPDGRARFATWANMNRSKKASPDGNDREHTEAWPGGRTNHYWYDLNRDWLPLVQPESKNRMARFHKWRPNVITDHHEMGSNSTFFFEPTKPGSENTIVPLENYTKLNTLFARGYSEVLDAAGHYYDSGMSFDNSYPGYGSSYGDINGGLAILFEQASSRGLVQKNDLGYEMHFSLGIKNQLLCALSTVNTAVQNASLLNDYMFRFYKDALKEASSDKYRAYVFGDKNDLGRTFDFANLLSMHKINVYALAKDITIEGDNYLKGSAFIVPTDQAQYKMIRTMFEARNEFPDSLFYDATAWALIYSYGLPFSGISKLPEYSEKITNLKKSPDPCSKSSYGYIFDWSDYYSASALNILQERGINAKASWEPVSTETSGIRQDFGRGSVFVPVAYQNINADELYKIITEVIIKTGITIYPVESSRSIEGPFMGNSSFRSLEKPDVLMLTGNGVSSSSAGTIWDMLDTRVGMTFTKVDISRIARVNLYDYNTIILPSGSYSAISKTINDKLIDWLSNGGNIIAIGSSMNYLKGLKLISYETNSAEMHKDRIDYNLSRLESGKHSIGGVFCSVDLDITHPLGFGFRERNITVYKNNRSFISKVEGSTSNVAIYKSSPIISGYVSDENRELFKGCASLIQFRSGRGNITLFVDDPVFRGCWRGTDKLLMNAIFFGGNL